jgi:heat shock protein HslJ
MKTHGLNLRPLLLCAILGVGVLTTACETSSKIAPGASTQSLLDTPWRLTQLGEEVVENPAGERAIHFVLQQANTNLVGFSGCNRMFGRYALDRASLKFDGLGGTRMFCQVNMAVEQKFLAMFQNVAGWRITGATLQLIDADAKAVATFTTP